MKVVELVPAARRRADAVNEIWAHLRASEQRPLTKDEHRRLREAEARANRRSGR